MIINFRKIILLCGFIFLLSAIACARPNPKICRKRNGKFPRPGTSCRGYYECKNFVPFEKTCGDDENFNANKGRCDWEDLYPCLEKQKDKECLRENGLFLKPGTNCKKYYRCCNGKAEVEACSGDLLFDPSKGNCEWSALYTCIESLSSTEKASSIETTFATSTPRPETSTDTEISKSTIQKTTVYDPDTSTKSSTQTTPNEDQSTFETRETLTISQTITSKILTSQPTTDISTILELKEISSTVISTPQPTITQILTLQPTTEISTSQPITTAILTTRSIVTEIPTSQSSTTEISTSQSTTTEISTSQSTVNEISTSQPKTTEISTSQPTTTEISTTQSTTTEISTSKPTSETSTLRPTTSEISKISRKTSPQMSSTHSTDHTISKENKEGELTEPTIFERTMEETFSPSTVEVTTSSEMNIMCPEPNGYFPHPTDKHKFVGCVSNIAYILSCPSDLVYKHHVRRCDHE